MDTHSKLEIVARGWLEGRQFHRASEAMVFAASYHTGQRKDGSPEFGHQIRIVHYLKTLWIPDFAVEDVLSAAFLHDLCEDHAVPFDTIELKFGAKVREAVYVLTKKFRGNYRSSYIQDLATNPIASLVKTGDRIDNLKTMHGVFSTDKQHEYLDEAEAILEAVKWGARAFPQFTSALMNSRMVLSALIDVIRVRLPARS